MFKVVLKVQGPKLNTSFWVEPGPKCPCIRIIKTKARKGLLRLMIEILHYLKDPKLWELW